MAGSIDKVDVVWERRRRDIGEGSRGLLLVFCTWRKGRPVESDGCRLDGDSACSLRWKEVGYCGTLVDVCVDLVELMEGKMGKCIPPILRVCPL
jgi:hypothetical protein